MATNNSQKFDLNNVEKYKLREGWFSFVTLFLAFMTVVASIVEGDWQPGIKLLTPIGLVAFFLGFGLARTRFVPALLAHSFMLSVGMVFVGIQVFPYTDPQYKSWSEKLGSTVLSVVKWCQLAVSGREHDDGLVFLVGLGLMVWLLGYATVWLVFRLHRPWWGLSLMGATLFVNLSYNPPGAFRSFGIFLLASLLLVIRMTVFLNEERWRRNRLFFRPGMWRSAMSVGGVITLLVTLLAFAAPSNDAVNPIKSMMDQLSGPLGGVQGGLNSFFVAPNGDKAHRDALSSNNFNSFDSSFKLGGPLKQSQDPILKVSGDDPTYLQSLIADEYDGSHWINTYQSAPTVTSTEVIFPPLALGPGQNLPTSSDKGRAENKITVTQLESTGFSLFVGGDLFNTTLPAVLRFHYEPINIEKVPLQAFQKVNGVLVDTTNNNKPVPPTLLPLLTSLYTAYKALPPSVSVVYSHQGSNWTVTYTNTNSEPKAGANGPKPISATTTHDGFYNAQIGDWTITLPTTNALQELGRRVRPGNRLIITTSNPNSPLPAPIFQAVNANSNSSLRLPTVQVYHSADDSWTFTYDPTINGDSDTVAKQKFEATPTGQAVKSTVSDLERLNQDMHIEYSVQNNQPLTLTVHGFAPNYDDLTGASAQQIVQPGQSYSTSSLRYRFDEQSLKEATTDYPDWVKERYLQLPATVPARVRDLALQITQGYTNPYEKARAIEAFLRDPQYFRYDENVDFVPTNRDFVDYFLFDTKVGYCTYFSTAMNVMLRSIGIPSREVEGFLGGEPNGDGTYTIKGTAAHAWTQVYFPGYGWVRFEPTPGRSVNELPADGSSVAPIPTPTVGTGGAAGNDPFANSDSNNIDPLTGKNKNRDPSQDQGDTSKSGGGGIIYTDPVGPPLWLLLSGLIVLVGVGLFGFNKLWVRTQMRLPVTTPAAVYTRLLKTARKAHIEPRNGMTQYEYARYLAKKLPNASQAITFITDRYVKSRYSQESEIEQAAHSATEKVLDENATDPDAASSYLDSNKVWTRLRVQGERHQAIVQVQDTWEAVQAELIRYRREKFLERLTPAFLHKYLQRTDTQT